MSPRHSLLHLHELDREILLEAMDCLEEDSIDLRVLTDEDADQVNLIKSALKVLLTFTNAEAILRGPA